MVKNNCLFPFIAFFTRVCHLCEVRHTRASAYTLVLPFLLMFVTRAKYAFGILGGNVQKPYFSVLKNGFGLLAGKYSSIFVTDTSQFTQK